MAGSVCDAIITPSPGQITFPILRRLQDAGICGDGVVASDAQCLQAVALAVRHLRVVIEPGGAVALACALFGGGTGDVIAVASGGNIDAGVLAGAVRDYDGGYDGGYSAGWMFAFASLTDRAMRYSPSSKISNP